MTASDDTANAVRAKLSTYTDPYLAQTLRQAQAIEVGFAAGRRGEHRTEVWLSLCGLCRRAAAGAAELSGAAFWPVPASISPSRRILPRTQCSARSNPSPTSRTSSPWPPGRGGSASRPRPRTWRSPGRRRVRGGSAGCRYLRSQPATDDGPRRRSSRNSDDGKHITPLAGPWRRGHVDRLHDRSRAAHGVAGAHGDPGTDPAAGRYQLG